MSRRRTKNGALITMLETEPTISATDGSPLALTRTESASVQGGMSPSARPASWSAAGAPEPSISATGPSSGVRAEGSDRSQAAGPARLMPITPSLSASAIEAEAAACGGESGPTLSIPPRSHARRPSAIGSILSVPLGASDEPAGSPWYQRAVGRAHALATAPSEAQEMQAHALLVAIAIGRREGRSLRVIAADTGMSAGYLSRLQNTRALLRRTRPLWASLTPAERRERLTVSRLRHVLRANGNEAVQRHGVEMVASRACHEREVRRFVDEELRTIRGDVRGGEAPAPCWLTTLVRQQRIRRLIVVRRAGTSSPPTVIHLTVEVPANCRAAVERLALPRGNAKTRGAAA